jgi:uncharacterized membrane protein YbhN (UPF0104 family)
MKKRYLLLALRILFAVGGLTYIAVSVQWTDQVDDEGKVRQGIMTVLRGADLSLLAVGLGLVALIYPIQSCRWWLLMRCRGLDVSLYKSFRLLMVGSFFNYSVPVGMTGGDVFKAYYAAKNSGRRADAVMSVIFDRVTGLLGLILLAGVAGLFKWEHDLARQITVYVWLGAAALVACALIYFSPRMRKSLGIDWLLAKLPGAKLFDAIDQATLAYGGHKRGVAAAVLISIPVHMLLAMAVASAGYAMGMNTEAASRGLMLIVMPVVTMVGALPVSVQGIGTMEAAAAALLPDVSFNVIVGMLMMLRLYQAFWSLTGALFLLRGDIHLHPESQAEPMQPDA